MNFNNRYIVGIDKDKVVAKKLGKKHNTNTSNKYNGKLRYIRDFLKEKADGGFDKC